MAMSASETSDQFSFSTMYLRLREQRRIAEILDTADEAIRSTERLIAKLEQGKQGLLHDLLTRGIDEIGHLRDPSAVRANSLRFGPRTAFLQGGKSSSCRATWRAYVLERVASIRGLVAEGYPMRPSWNISSGSYFVRSTDDVPAHADG